MLIRENRGKVYLKWLVCRVFQEDESINDFHACDVLQMNPYGDSIMMPHGSMECYLIHEDNIKCYGELGPLDDVGF